MSLFSARCQSLFSLALRFWTLSSSQASCLRQPGSWPTRLLARARSGGRSVRPLSPKGRPNSHAASPLQRPLLGQQRDFALTLLVAPAHALPHSRGRACQLSLASPQRRSRPLPTQACASAAAGLGTAGAHVLTARGKPQPLTQTNLQLLALWWLNLLFCLMMHLFSLLLT